MFRNTTPDLQDHDQDHSVQDQDQDHFLVSDRSCPKTDVLRPHHWFPVDQLRPHPMWRGPSAAKSFGPPTYTHTV